MSLLSRSILPCMIAPITCETVSATEKKVSAAFLFPPSFVGFTGHFPNRPILPGMVQIMLAVTVAAQGEAIPENTGKENTVLALQSIKRCKFSRVIEPEETIVVAVHLTERDGCTHGKAILSVNDEAASALSFVCTPSSPSSIRKHP